MAATPDDKLCPEFAAEYAAFSSGLTPDQLSTEVIKAVQTNLFDTLACAVAGISANGVSSLIEIAEDWGGKPEAAIWCTGHRVPAPLAAWVNGMMSHARDFDDTHDAAVLHAGVSVVPAALAAAEAAPDATGSDVIAGVAAGLELISRLGVSTTVGIIETGFMYTSLFGHFAATAAAARVWRLSIEDTVNALGIAYSQAAGTHQVTRDAALTKRIQPGFAAKTAQVSVAMARKGIRGAQRTFEGEDGLFRSYFHNRYDPERLRAGLGKHFDLVDLSYKPYPCCRFNHTAIDAALAIRKQMEPGTKVLGVKAMVNRQAYEAVATPIEVRKHPRTIVQAQFSIPYTVAVALQKGAVGLIDFTEESLSNPEVLALAALVDVTVDAGIERDWSRNISPTVLVVETDRGRFEHRVDFPHGNAANPLPIAAFDSKLKGCMEISGLAWPDNLPDRLRGAIHGLSGAGSGRDIVDCLIPLQG